MWACRLVIAGQERTAAVAGSKEAAENEAARLVLQAIGLVAQSGGGENRSSSSNIGGYILRRKQNQQRGVA